jgi:hypothetical protein
VHREAFHDYVDAGPLGYGFGDRLSARANRRSRRRTAQQTLSPGSLPAGLHVRTRPSRFTTWCKARPSPDSTRSVAVGVTVPLTGSKVILFTADRIRMRLSAGTENDLSTSPPAPQLAAEMPLQPQAAAGPVWTV